MTRKMCLWTQEIFLTSSVLGQQKMQPNQQHLFTSYLKQLCLQTLLKSDLLEKVTKTTKSCILMKHSSKKEPKKCL